jgi:hypothetical protein
MGCVVAPMPGSAPAKKGSPPLNPAGLKPLDHKTPKKFQGNWFDHFLGNLKLFLNLPVLSSRTEANAITRSKDDKNGV